MKIKFSKKTLRIYAINGEGEIVKNVKIDGASNQNFENAVKVFLSMFNCDELEIIGGHVNLDFNFTIE